MKTTDNIETKTASKSIANVIGKQQSVLQVAELIQPKPTIGQTNDKYEQEADRVANQVISMPESSLQKQPLEEEEEMLQSKPILQLQPIEEEEEELMPKLQLQPLEEEEEMLQTKPLLQLQPLKEEEEMIQPNWIQKAGCSGCGEKEISKLQTSTQAIQMSPLYHIELCGGQTLPDSNRNFFESRMGYNFSNVRVHTSDSAIQMNQQLGAQAFTYGNSIFFNKGKYNPVSMDGRKLLAHELTHVMQQQDRISRSPDWEGIKFVHQIDFTPKTEDIEYGKSKSSLVPFSLQNKIKNALKDKNLTNQLFWIEMTASVHDCMKKAEIYFEPGVRYIYTLSGRFSGNEIIWIRILMHKPKSVQYDWGEVTISSSEKTESVEYEEDLRIEELEAKLEGAADNIEKLDAWLQMAEFALDGESAEKMAALRNKVRQLSDSLSTAIDIKNKTVAGAKLVASFQQALHVEPGSAGGIKAASSILYALGEFGQEIPVLGGALSGYLEFFKAPETMRKLGKRLVDLHHRKMKRALTGR